MIAETHVSETLTPGALIATVDEPIAGSVAVIFSRGRFRTAKIASVGPKRVQIEYVTRAGGTVTRSPQPRAAVWRACFGDDPDLAGVVRQKHGRGGQYLEEA